MSDIKNRMAHQFTVRDLLSHHTAYSVDSITDYYVSISSIGSIVFCHIKQSVEMHLMINDTDATSVFPLHCKGEFC